MPQITWDRVDYTNPLFTTKPVLEGFDERESLDFSLPLNKEIEYI